VYDAGSAARSWADGAAPHERVAAAASAPTEPQGAGDPKETRERLQDGITVALRAVPLAISTIDSLARHDRL
jgi:hypothetical protein